MELWRRLDADAEYYFGTASWVELATAGVDRRIAWNATYRNGRLAFVGALGVRRFGAGLLECRVFRDLFPLFECPPLLDAVLDPGIEPPLSLQEVMDGFGRWHVVALRGVREKSPWLRLSGPSDMVEAEPDGGSGVFDTSAPFEQRWRTVSRRLQRTVRRGRERMGDRGRTVIAAGDALGPAFDEYVKLEARGWKGREGTSLSQRPVEREVLRDYMLANDGAQVHSIFVDGVLAASLLTVACKSTRSMLKTAYNEELSGLAPGYLGLAGLIESCCNDRTIDRLDCVVWQPFYSDWGMVREPTYKLIAFNSRALWGRLAQVAWRNRGARQSIRAALKKIRSLTDRRAHDGPGQGD